MAPMAPIVVPSMGAPAPTNVVIVSKIPDGVTEHLLSAGAGRSTDLLKMSFRKADIDGPGWAIMAFTTPEIARQAQERLHGKPLMGAGKPTGPLDASLGEGLFGPIRTPDDRASPWKEARTPTGQVYYYHTATRQTSWIKPPPEFPPAPAPPAPNQPPPPASAQPPAAKGPQGASAACAARPYPGAPPPPVPTPPPPVQGAQAMALAQTAISSAARAAELSAVETAGLAANSAGPVGANLFVYHIPNSWDDMILKQHFEHFGTILSCRVQKDAEGRPRGFGFVSYDTPGAAAAAIAGMHGFPVEGKWLKVQLKKGDEQQLDKSLLPTIGGPSSPGIVEVGSQPGVPPPPAPPPPGAPDMGMSGAMHAGTMPPVGVMPPGAGSLMGSMPPPTGPMVGPMAALPPAPPPVFPGATVVPPRPGYTPPRWGPY